MERDDSFCRLMSDLALRYSTSAALYVLTWTAITTKLWLEDESTMAWLDDPILQLWFASMTEYSVDKKMLV